MPIGLLTLDIHLPYAHSLKDKRLVLRKIKDRLRTRFNVSVAELDHHDLWQRSVVGVVTISSDQQNLETVLEAVERESASILGGDLAGVHREYF
ncbi:MAG: DUF503 domain-containing protein [Acidobacteria bacterium]|nr:DUF503 domain-containing protein [Acidobacteriota bacterium]